MLSEECAWPVTDHARVAETSQHNAWNVLMDSSTLMADASNHALKTLTLTWFQDLVVNAIHHARLAALS